MNKEKIKIALAIFGVAAIVTTASLALNVIVYYDAITKGAFGYVLCELFGNGYNRGGLQYEEFAYTYADIRYFICIFVVCVRL